MQKYSIVLIFLLASICYSQDLPVLKYPRADWDTNANFDKDKKLCKERGHIKPTVYESTAMFCPDRYEEYQDLTVVVHVGCNYIRYRCIRCLQDVEEKEKTVREVIWRKEK